jgi:SAM-dependent methyltransferase
VIGFERALVPDPDADEIERICEEYRRRERETPPGLYDLSRAAPRFAYTRLLPVVTAALGRADKLPLAGRALADVGCGNGMWLRQFVRWGADPAALRGIDLIGTRIGVARTRVPGASLVCGDARSLPWSDESFDVVTQFMVFSSILRASVKQRIADEMLRVLKPDGAILWYDSRRSNPRNPNVRALGAAEIRRLFPDCDVRLRSVTLAPPLARRVVPLFPAAGVLLESIPLLRTHFFGVIRKHAGRGSA